MIYYKIKVVGNRQSLHAICFRVASFGPRMVTDMTQLQNAEFKEAFDEFDKVRRCRDNKLKCVIYYKPGIAMFMIISGSMVVC